MDNSIERSNDNEEHKTSDEMKEDATDEEYRGGGDEVDGSVLPPQVPGPNGEHMTAEQGSTSLEQTETLECLDGDQTAPYSSDGGKKRRRNPHGGKAAEMKNQILNGAPNEKVPESLEEFRDDEQSWDNTNETQPKHGVPAEPRVHRSNSVPSTPGAFPVLGRGFGQYPAWGRNQSPNTNQSSQQQPSGRRIISYLSGLHPRSTSAIDADATMTVPSARTVLDGEPISATLIEDGRNEANNAELVSELQNKLTELERKSPFQNWRVILVLVVMAILCVLAVLLAIFIPRSGDENDCENGVPYEMVLKLRELDRILSDSLYENESQHHIGKCSPRFYAMNWMVSEDKWYRSLDEGALSDNQTKSKIVQRYVLADFFMALDSSNSAFKETWLTGEDECLWEGVTCLESMVEELSLSKKDLEGYLQTEIGSLSFLVFLDLGGNEFVGPIPTELGKIPYLQELRMPHNKFNGTLPTEFGLLTSLHELDLRNNKLMGSIPHQLGFLPEVSRMDLRENRLIGTMPDGICENSTRFVKWSMSLVHVVFPD